MTTPDELGIKTRREVDNQLLSAIMEAKVPVSDDNIEYRSCA